MRVLAVALATSALLAWAVPARAADTYDSIRVVAADLAPAANTGAFASPGAERLTSALRAGWQIAAAYEVTDASHNADMVFLLKKGPAAAYEVRGLAVPAAAAGVSAMEPAEVGNAAATALNGVTAQGWNVVGAYYRLLGDAPQVVYILQRPGPGVPIQKG